MESAENARRYMMKTNKTPGRSTMKPLLLIAGIACLLFTTFVSAKDIDIYDINVKNNAYVLMDNSGSMANGVYQNTIDYGEIFEF